MIGGVSNKDVLVVSGTLPAVSYEERQSLLNLCPEMKVFYPALHDPNCFGAKPDGDKCALRLLVNNIYNIVCSDIVCDIYNTL